MLSYDWSDCGRVHGGQSGTAVYFIPIGRPQEQQARGGASTDTPPGDEPHARPSG